MPTWRDSGSAWHRSKSWQGGFRSLTLRVAPRSHYNLALGGIFALACGFFLLVEILFFGLAPTDTSPFPAWGLWFVAIMFLILGSLCIIGAVADFGDAGTKTR